MPPAFLCGLELCLGHQPYLLGLCLFYPLLAFSLLRCAQSTGPARWAFGTALLFALAHMATALTLASGRSAGVEDRLIGTIFSVVALVGLGGAQLAMHQGSKVIALGLLATVGLVGAAVLGYSGPLDDHRLFLIAFFGQAALLWKCRQHETLPAEGTGFIQTRTSGN
jgi:hypothetical protein